MNKRMVPMVIAGALTLVTAFGIVSYQKVSAQAPTPTATASTQANRSAPPDWAFGGMRGEGKFGGESGDTRTAALASALGISEADLQAAQTAALANGLAQAVDQGLITQAQADRITANRDGHMPFGGGRGLGQSTIDPQALLAEALGISVDDLAAAQQKALNTIIDDAVAAGNLTAEQADLMKGRQVIAHDSTFQSAMTSAYEAAVNQAVSSGVITQAQADQLLLKSAQRPGGWNGNGMPGRMGEGRGGRGNHGAGNGMMCDDIVTTQ